MGMSTIGLISLLAITTPQATASARTIKAPNSTVTAIEDIELPAQEAGVLQKVLVQEGTQVAPEQLLAQIDDRQTQLQLEVAGLKLEAAKKEADDRTSIEYAKAARKLAGADLKRAQDANRKVKGSVSQAEIDRLQLVYDRTFWEIERATMQQAIAQAQAAVSGAEVRAAEDSLRRRQIIAPFAGVVENVYRHANEWVKPGDPVVRIVQVDRLYVTGDVSADIYRRGQIEGRRVTVTVQLPQRSPVEFAGTINFVSHVVTAGRFRIRAEVVNRNEGGQWLLLPGLTAEMTIQLK